MSETIADILLMVAAFLGGMSCEAFIQMKKRRHERMTERQSRKNPRNNGTEPTPQEFIERLRAFTRPSWRGFFRSRFFAIMRWIRPPHTRAPTDGFAIGDVVELGDITATIESKTATTLTLDNGTTITL